MNTATTTPAPERLTVRPTGPGTRISLTEAAGGGRARLRLDARSAPDRPTLRPMVLAADGTSARVALVPDGALLLAGDAVRLHVDVGPGLALDLVEPSGTVAYDMHGDTARWDVSIQLGAGAVLTWHGEPFVVSAGARVRRTTTVVLGLAARLALRETLVLGRSGEVAGVLDQRLDVRRDDGTPVLVEGLLLDRSRTRILLGGGRVLDSILVLGASPPGAPGRDRLDLEEGGTLLRRLGDEAHLGLGARVWWDAVAAVGR